MILFCIFSVFMLWISVKAFIFFVAMVLFLCFRKRILESVDKPPSINTQKEIKAFLAVNKTLFYISTPVAGTISRIMVNASDNVNNGDVMFYLIDDNGVEDNITVTIDAHVYKLLVQEGDYVVEGQNLAEMDNFS